MEKKLRLLIVDDSATSRELLKQIAQTDPQIEVIATLCNGMEAVAYIEKHPPDVVLMDIHMPIMDGFEATRRIMLTKPVPIIICSADYNPKDIQTSFQAIEAGALVILEKPPGPLHPNFRQHAKLYADTIKMVAGVKLITRKSSSILSIQKNKSDSPIRLKSLSAVAIGASLGGPQALQFIFSKITPSFPLPIFVMQHIAADFAQGLANWLNDTSKLEVIVPKNGDKALPSKIYLAPGESFMEVLKDDTIKIAMIKPGEEKGPTISRLFYSMAKTYGDKGMGIILTGMGRDGVDGLLEMKNRGALTIAQDEEDCVMYGMPKEAAAMGAAVHIVNIKEIPTILNRYPVHVAL